MAFSGVFPVYNLVFKIGKRGKASTAPADMVTIADMETFGIAIDGSVEEWTSMTTAGWTRALMTGKKFSISLNGKRSVGDPGNDYVADTAWKDGLDCSTKGEILFPDGAKLAFDCVINVKNVGGGDSTNVAPLEFDLQGDGKPTYTPATPVAPIALSIATPTNNATGVAIAVRPALTFNNAIYDATGITLLNGTDGALVPYTVAFDGTGKIATITPTASLVAGKTYFITLSEVADIYGQELPQQIIKFTT